MKWAPVRALKLPTISICIVFQGEAIGDDGKSPNPLFWVETASFRVEVFDVFLVDLWVPLTNEKKKNSCEEATKIIDFLKNAKNIMFFNVSHRPESDFG